MHAAASAAHLRAVRPPERQEQAVEGQVDEGFGGGELSSADLPAGPQSRQAGRRMRESGCRRCLLEIDALPRRLVQQPFTEPRLVQQLTGTPQTRRL